MAQALKVLVVLCFLGSEMVVQSLYLECVEPFIRISNKQLRTT